MLPVESLVRAGLRGFLAGAWVTLLYPLGGGFWVYFLSLKDTPSRTWGFNDEDMAS